MESDYGLPRDLSHLQLARSLYRPELPPCLQGTTVRVEFGDATTGVDTAGAHAVAQSFPHTYGQPLAHFLRATSNVTDAQIISDHPAIRRHGIIMHISSGGTNSLLTTSVVDAASHYFQE
nr:pyrophosphate--fructose 6-phosphate 1-phosphotransferase subunit alpha-like [Tanacetum cinerariifolium]